MKTETIYKKLKALEKVIRPKFEAYQNTPLMEKFSDLRVKYLKTINNENNR